jgi:bifunctional non-homologous end joining protein LigD
MRSPWRTHPAEEHVAKTAVRIGGVGISSPDDVLYPGQGITKRELAEYYDAVASHMLAELRGRPLTLVRCPEGEGEACFYQRHASERGPFAALRQVSLGEGDSAAEFLVVAGRRALLSLPQMRVLEVHAWNARADRADRPDRLVLDLDPGPGVGWSEITDAAFYFRDRLEAAGLAAWVKTTGGKGLHVIAPLARRHTHARVREAARALAESAAREAPDRFLAHAAKSDRPGRIYVDYLRNGWGASAVAAFSTRARPGAPVSTPVSWDELGRGVRPEDFDVRSVPRRLATLREDPWAGYAAAAAQRITRSAGLALGLS